MSHLTCAIEDGVATILIDNPPQNRLGLEHLDSFEAAIDKIGDSGARAVLVRAEGDNFSYGGDISPWPGQSAGELRALFERWLTVYNRFERLPIPTLAAVKGLCLGGGFELALRCDLIIAGASAKFGQPEQTLALTTLLGGVYRVAERAGRSFAANMAFTSAQIAADEMHSRGIVTRLVSDSDLDAASLELALQLAHGPTRAHAAHKALLRLWALGSVQAADEAIFDISMPLFKTQDALRGLASATDALKRGKKRPTLTFDGR
jgi:enoyl-CoA hydratase/carnithine racemase